MIIITTEQGLDNVGKEDNETGDKKENKGTVHETIIPENIDQNKQESDSGVSSDKSEYYKELVKGLVQKQRELEQKVDELESKIGTAEEERDFYFEKLRDIEDFCDYRRSGNVNKSSIFFFRRVVFEVSESFLL